MKVSKITVENAYNQLLAEGYIRAEEKVGYFVETVEQIRLTVEPERKIQNPREDWIDLTANNPVKFPFSVWSRLHRQALMDLGHNLLQPVPNQGLPDLRQAIARHLAQFRGMQVGTEQIFIGAGTDFLYNLLIQLLGRDKCYAVEEPGYGKIRKIYAAAGAGCMTAAMDEQGVCPNSLAGADVLHISPSHHFPTGLVTPLSRRQELLSWVKAGAERWIIEDDYDSEFRFASRPLPAMQSLDGSRVIYMNTFSKTLAPSIRISYMVLPVQLMEKLQQKLGFYSCTVPSFEQHTLARFLEEGYFEKHINRMRKFYKSRRNRILAAIEACPMAEKLSIMEENAGLHFLVRVDSAMTDEALEAYCRNLGIRVRCLSSYYNGSVPRWAERCLVVNYSGLTDECMERLEEKLAQGI